MWKEENGKHQGERETWKAENRNSFQLSWVLLSALAFTPPPAAGFLTGWLPEGAADLSAPNTRRHPRQKVSSPAPIWNGTGSFSESPGWTSAGTFS
jgi:hypothetical protein